ncbi:hypothetical protein E2C01_070501 [Portunus trituberculatus]|uniref:Uncharacterized protein n=1 Tax=Portunus trituberculatus TaxID=210409 RepID=A0A5B7I298_PORTR|nr:hypothetical protein [Portunus trituberculatus]
MSLYLPPDARLSKPFSLHHPRPDSAKHPANPPPSHPSPASSYHHPRVNNSFTSLLGNSI